jgi:hypothetical protein
LQCKTNRRLALCTKSVEFLRWTVTG